MSASLDMALTNFSFQGEDLKVNFLESTQVVPGVTCDAYEFVGDASKDLGLITLEPVTKTPRQLVLLGDKTIEGYVSGVGSLEITRASGSQEIYHFDAIKKSFTIEVLIGDTMQWIAGPEAVLLIYEICFPPYIEGRFRNLSQNPPE